MIEKRVCKILQVEYEKHLLIYDTENFVSYFDYQSILLSRGFTVFFYDDIERIRYVYETQIRESDESFAIIVNSNIYVPTDIRNDFFEVQISLKTVYPSMNEQSLQRHIYYLDLIDRSYDEFERNCVREAETEYYIDKHSYSYGNIQG